MFIVRHCETLQFRRALRRGSVEDNFRFPVRVISLRIEWVLPSQLGPYKGLGAMAEISWVDRILGVTMAKREALAAPRQSGVRTCSWIKRISPISL